MGNSSYSVGTLATHVQGAVHCLYSGACVRACVCKCATKRKKKKKRQKTKQKLGHLHGTDTSPLQTDI